MGHCSLGLDQACIAILNRSVKFDPRTVIVEQYPWSIVRLLNGYVNGYVKPLFSLDVNGKLQLKKSPPIREVETGEARDRHLLRLS